MPGTLTWMSEKSHQAVTSVSPAAAVRVVLPPSLNDSAEIDVFSIPERVLVRVIRMLPWKSPGRKVRSLWVEQGKLFDGRKLSIVWSASAGPIRRNASELRARTGGLPLSDPLFVQPNIRIVTTNPERSLRVDPTTILLPVPVELEFKNGRQWVEVEFSATVDPTFDVRVMTPTTEPSLRTYLDEYLPMIAGEQEVDVEAFVNAFNDEYQKYLENGADINDVEAHPPTIELGGGESEKVDLYPYPGETGHAMIAVAAIDPVTEVLVSVSDLIGLTVGSDGVIYRDF